MNSLPDTPAESGDICVNAKSIFDDWYLLPVGTLRQKKKGDKVLLAYQAWPRVVAISAASSQDTVSTDSWRCRYTENSGRPTRLCSCTTQVCVCRESPCSNCGSTSGEYVTSLDWSWQNTIENVAGNPKFPQGIPIMRCIGIILISSSFFCPKVTDYQLCHMAAVAKDHTVRLVDSQCQQMTPQSTTIQLENCIRSYS